MLNNYGDTGSGFGGHGQPSAPLPRSMEHSKQQNVAPSWSYNTQLEGLYSCYPSEPQPMYNIHSMGHFESSGKHNNNHYSQYPAGAMHQPVPTPVVKCHEACCQNLSDHSRYPVNPAPLRYPPTVSVQPPRYGDVTNSEHRQYFQDRRGLQSSVARKKEFQADGGFTGVHHDRHFSQCVGRGQIHVPENRQSMQVVRSQYPMYPINSYWSPRSWTGPRVNYPPPPPYHQSVSSQSAQLQSGIKVPEPPHYMEPNMQKQLGNQQRRTTLRNGNGTTEVVRPVPENKRPAIDGNHIQSCYDFPYTSGFVPFNDVSKITSNSISQITNTSCKISNDKQFQHQMQYSVQSNDRTVSGCNDPMSDISYSMNFSIPNGESYMRQPVEGSEQIPTTRKLAVQYEQPPVGKKRPDLDVRQFLATWEDDEEDSARMSEPLTNNSSGAPYIVVDYRSLDNEPSAKTQERLKPSGVQICSSKPQNSSPGLDNKRQTSEDVNSREKESQRSIIHSEYLAQNSFLQPTAPTMHNDVEKNINFWGPNTRENCPVSEGLMSKSVFQPLDCSKRDTLNIVEPIMPQKRDSHMHGDLSNHKMMSADSNHISFDALVTYYGDSRRGSDGSYDLVEMTERLVNATDKICTSERSLEQQLPPDIMGCNEMRAHHQPQIGVNPNSFHNRMPPHYAGNTFQHFKQSVSTDGFFNLKQPVAAHSKYFSIDQQQMMDQGNFEYHKGPAEFENKRTYDVKDNTGTTKIQEGVILKDGRKSCQENNKKALCNESLKNSAVESSTQSHDKENVEFDGVDPEQFITPIIIKKSDYQSKTCDKSEDTTKEKNSQTETEKVVFNSGSERTVLISNDIEADVFKVPYSPDKKQFLQKDNVVTLHSGDNTKCNTVTVEVPYVQQYSNLVKLSEEMTQADNIPDNKNCSPNEIQYNTSNICGPSADINNKIDESKRTTNLKLKRLPNSHEWIKINEEMKSSEKNDCVNEKHNMKDSKLDSMENSPARAINLNMPSLDDNENISHIENALETQKVIPAECRGTSNYSSRSRHNDSINPDSMSIPQLAIVSPLKFVSNNKEENNTPIQSNIKQKKDIYFQADKQFFSNSTNSQSYEDTSSNSCLQREIENQFHQVHSPYNTLYLSEKQNLVQSGHSSPAKHFSDIQYLSENCNEKHENVKPQKKVQRVESFQQATSTDINENNQQIMNSKDNNKEQFSSFYSGRDITSHMSPFNLSTRLLTNEKDLDHHIPTSPGVDEMFEDINNPGHDSLFQNKTDNLPELTENSSFTLTSSCQTGNSFDSFFEQGSSAEGSRPCENVKISSEGSTLNQSKTPDDGSRARCSIIMKENDVDSSGCENFPTESGEQPLTVKVNSPKSTWTLSQNRETCKEKNGLVSVERNTNFATLNSSEQVSSSEKDFINDSFHSFDYVHTSVLQEMNSAAINSSSEIAVDTSEHKGKCTNLDKETKLQEESKSEYSLINSNSEVNSASRVSGKQEHTSTNCSSEKVSENSDSKEKKIIILDESNINLSCTTKLDSVDNILPVESNENIDDNQCDENFKSSLLCDFSQVSNCESIKHDSEIIQSDMSGVLKTAVECEDIKSCGKCNTTESKYDVIENDTGDTNPLKQVCDGLSGSDKTNNKYEKLPVGLCNESESKILSEKDKNQVGEENVKCTIDSVYCDSSGTDSETCLTVSVHNGCNENPQLIAEGNCNPIINDAHSIYLVNQTVQNGESGNQEALELTVNKIEESCKGRTYETNCDRNIVDIDCRLTMDENSSHGNENCIKENSESERRETSKITPFNNIHLEHTSITCGNMQHKIDQEAILPKTDMRKSQKSEEDNSEITVKQCGTGDDCKSVLLSKDKPDLEISRCSLVNDSEAENDSSGSIMNKKYIKIIEDTQKSEQKLLNTLSDKTEQIGIENDENGQNENGREICKGPEEERKFENETVVTETKTEYKNAIKCSHGSSKIAVVSPLQSVGYKHSDNMILDTENTRKSREYNDSFRGDCSTVLNIMATNKPAFIPEEVKQKNEKVNSSNNEIICTAAESEDYSKSLTDTEQGQIISNHSSRSETCIMSRSSDTLTTRDLNQLEMPELSQNKVSSLQCKIHAEYKAESGNVDIKAYHFNSDETVVKNKMKENVLEDLMKEKTTDQNNVECSSKCNVHSNFSGEMANRELNIEKLMSTDDKEHSVCSITNHQNFEINKMQIENNCDSLIKIQEKMYSDNICQSSSERSQSVHDPEIETNSEFISTDFTHSESVSARSKFDVEINNAELHLEKKSVSTDREVVIENKNSASECTEDAETKTEDTIIHAETNVILYTSNSITENSKRNETCDVHSHIPDSPLMNKINIPDETLNSNLCTASDLNKGVQRDENKTGVSSAVYNSHCITENSVLEEFSLNESETKEQDMENEISAKETTDSILLKSENSSLNPLICVYPNMGNSLIQITESDSGKEHKREYGCTTDESILESKHETNVDCKLLATDDYNKSELKIPETTQSLNFLANKVQSEVELLTNSGENYQDSTSSENVTVSASNSDSTYKNVCTLVSSESDNLTSNENTACGIIQYEPVCDKSNIDNSYERSLCTYDKERIFVFKGDKRQDLKTQSDNNFRPCTHSSDSEIERHSELQIQTVDHTSTVTESECDNKVMDLSCNLVKHNWDDYPNFENVDYEESKKTDCDGYKIKHASVDCSCFIARNHHETINKTADRKYRKQRTDEIVSSDDDLNPSLETKQKIVNTDISLYNKSSNNISVNCCSERVSTETKCKGDYLRVGGTCENESIDPQFVDNIKETEEVDRLKNEPVASSNFSIDGELRSPENNFINAYHMSDSALVEDHSFDEGNEKDSKILYKSPSKSPRSINNENLLHVEEPSDFSNKNSNIVSLENVNDRTDKSHLCISDCTDTSLSIEKCNSVYESNANVEGVVNVYNTDNKDKCEDIKIESESKLYERADISNLPNKTCEGDSDTIVDISLESKDDVEIHQKVLSSPNVKNCVEFLLHNTQHENFSRSEIMQVGSRQTTSDIQESCIPVNEKEGDMKSHIKSKIRTCSINGSQLENSSIRNNSNKEVMDEDKIEININKSEVDADTENASTVISKENRSDLYDVSTDVCTTNLEPESVYINQNEYLDINNVSQSSNEKTCVEDSLLENIDRVRNSLTLSGNNNFEKLLEPYEFQSSLYSDVSIKSEILSNITNIPSKESCPLQCLVEAALALETAVVNKISQENTDGIQNEHVNKRKNFYCDNSVNEDTKNIVTNNSTTRTLQKSVDISFGSNSEEIRCCNEMSSEDVNVSSDEQYLPKYQRRKGIKQKEKMKTNKKSKKNCIQQLKCTRSKTEVTANSNDNLTKDQCIEFAYENPKDSDVDSRFQCDSHNVYHKTSGVVPNECREECLTPSVPFEDNKISHDTICVTDGDTEYSQRDFIVPDQPVVCFQVTSDKMDEYMNHVSNLSDVEVVTENADNDNVSVTKSVGNKSCVDDYTKIPDVNLENETSLVIIIEEIGSTSEIIPNKQENITLEESVEHTNDSDIKMSEEKKEDSSCTSLHNESTDNEQLSTIDRGIRDKENLKTRNVKNIFDHSEEQKLDLWCETSETYEHINENLVNGISNWPFLEEEIALEQNNSSQNSESKKQTYHLKCSLPWERIFNISNSRKRKTSRSKQDMNVGLELGPAKVEVRLGTESGVWKVVNNSPNDCSSPVVKVKRLILQRDPDLTSSYSEKESEEENDTKEKRKDSLSQSSDDLVPKIVIKKKSTSEYTSFLRLSDDEKWQPVVMLTRSKEIDELILREKPIVSSLCDKNILDTGENDNHERQPLDIFNYISENESIEEIKLNNPKENVLPLISESIYKNAVKKKPLKRRFRFGKLKERKFSKSNYFCSNPLSTENRVFSDDESSGSNKESDYSPICPVDASQEFAWQCIEKNGEESPETDCKDFVTDCIISQEDTAVQNEECKNIMDVVSSNTEFSNSLGRNSSEILPEDTVPIQCAVYTANVKTNSLNSSDNGMGSKDDYVSIKSHDTVLNRVGETSGSNVTEDVKFCNLTVNEEVNEDADLRENERNAIETQDKSISDDGFLNQDQIELENEASKNGVDQSQLCSANSESDIQLFGSGNEICVQTIQCNDPLLSKSVRDIIVEKPPSENRDRGLKRPSEGHSREDTKRRRYNIKQYPLECHKCHIGFEDKEELMRHKKSRHTPRELHHCLLCQRSFSSSLRYTLHVQGRSHRHIDLVQRYTMHTVHRLITGSDYPLVRPLTKSELQAMDWRPNYPGCNHYYHQPTPLQIALQEHNKGDNKIAVNHT